MFPCNVGALFLNESRVHINQTKSRDGLRDNGLRNEDGRLHRLKLHDSPFATCPRKISNGAEGRITRASEDLGDMRPTGAKFSRNICFANASFLHQFGNSIQCPKRQTFALRLAVRFIGRFISASPAFIRRHSVSLHKASSAFFSEADITCRKTILFFLCAVAYHQSVAGRKKTQKPYLERFKFENILATFYLLEFLPIGNFSFFAHHLKQVIYLSAIGR